MEAQNKIFHTENLELIAKIANLQITINKEYQTMTSADGLEYEFNYHMQMKDGSISNHTDKRVVKSDYSLKSTIESIEVFYGSKPEWAKKVLTAQKKYNKLMKEYKTLKTELAGIGRGLEIELRIY